ncbi:MAG: YabP/YqfC family sporulation protein [bacterium]
MIENNSQISHEVKIVDRNFISLTGIIKITSFNDEEFLLESNMGNIHIKGSGLEVLKMDTMDGLVKIKGHILSLIYLDRTIKGKVKEESLVAKLFK